MAPRPPGPALALMRKTSRSADPASAKPPAPRSRSSCTAAMSGDSGVGESCRSSRRPTRGGERPPPTASAVALLGEPGGVRDPSPIASPERPAKAWLRLPRPQTPSPPPPPPPALPLLAAVWGFLSTPPTSPLEREGADVSLSVGHGRLPGTSTLTQSLASSLGRSRTAWKSHPTLSPSLPSPRARNTAPFHPLKPPSAGASKGKTAPMREAETRVMSKSWAAKASPGRSRAPASRPSWHCWKYLSSSASRAAACPPSPPPPPPLRRQRHSGGPGAGSMAPQRDPRRQPGRSRRRPPQRRARSRQRLPLHTRPWTSPGALRGARPQCTPTRAPTAPRRPLPGLGPARAPPPTPLPAAPPL